MSLATLLQLSGCIGLLLFGIESIWLQLWGLKFVMVVVSPLASVADRSPVRWTSSSRCGRRS